MDLNTLLAQAVAAVNKGANPEAVNARVREIAIKNGWADESAEFNIQPDIDKQTRKEYNQAVIPSVLREASQLPYSPAPFRNVRGGVKTDMFNNVEHGVDTDYFPDTANTALKKFANFDKSLTAAVEGSLAKGIGGVEMAGAGLLNLSPIVPQSVVDRAFQEAKETSERGRQKLAAATGAGAIAGNVAGGLLTAGVGAAPSAAQDVIDSGGDLPTAYKELAKTAAVTEASVAAGLLGNQAKGLLPFLSRAGRQVPAAVALTAADKALSGEDVASKDSVKDYALAAGMGLGGALFRNPEKPKAKEPSLPETGNAAFDAGVKAADSIAESHTDLGTFDVSKQKPFKEQFDPGWTWKPESPEQKTTIDTSPAEAVRNMKDLLAERAARQRAKTNEIFAESDRLQNAQEISRAAIEDGTLPPVEQPAPSPNTPLATPEMQQLRSDLAVEQATKNAGMPEQPEGISISAEPTPQQLPPDITTKLGKQKLSVDAAGNTVPAEAPIKTQPRSLAESIAALKERRSAILELPTKNGPVSSLEQRYYSPEHVPTHWSDRMQKGELTVKEVLDDVIKSTSYHPQIVEFTKAIRDLADKLGGDDVTYRAFDENDPAHAGYLADKALNSGKAGAGYFTLSDRTIRLDPGQQSVHAYLHEGTHAITSKAIEAGRQGKLSEPAQRAYKRLERLYKEVVPDIKERASSDAVANQHQTYGAENIHEFITELYTNPAFREHLRKIPVEPIAERTSGDTRTAIAVIRNKYQQVVSTIRQMLGISPKAENVLDAVIGGSHDFFNTVDPKEVGGIAVKGRFNLPAKEDQLQKPRGWLGSRARTFLSSKGLEPVATAARNVREGISAQGDAEAAQAGNRLASVVTSTNRADVAAALTGDMSALARLDPAAKAAVKQEVLGNFDRSIEIAKQIAADPNLTEAQKDIAHTILDKAGKYQTRVYEADINTKYMKNKLDMAEQAKAKIANGAEPSEQELSAMKDVDAARKYLENQWLPDTNRLPSMTNERLEELYKFHTGLNPDEQFKGFDKADRKAALAGAVADKLRNMANKDGTLDEIVRIAAGLSDRKNASRQYHAGMRRGSDIYSELKDVPEELRQFRGEISEPIARNVATVRAQYNYLSNLTAQNSLRENGLAKGLFSPDRNTTHTEVISGEKMGPLQGLFTTPDVKRAVDSIFTMNAAVGDFMDAALSDRSGATMMLNALHHVGKGVSAAAGTTKLMSVLGNVGNLANNFIGSHLQLLSNGNINPASWAKGAKMMADSMMLERRSNMSNDARDALRYKLVEYSHIQELQRNNSKTQMMKYIQEASDQPDPLRYLKKMRDAGRIPLEVYKELYGSMDLWTKMANWHNELNFWKAHNEKYGTGLTEEQIKQAVADRINDTNITPSMAPLLLKGLERYGLTRFATYYSEVMRTTKNNALLGGKDVMDGFKNGQYELVLHGMRRLLGTSASIAFQNKQIAALATAVAGAAGLAAEQLDDNDPRKKYMKKDDFLKSTDPLIISDPNRPEAGQFVYDLSRPDPYGPVSIPTRNLIDAVKKAEAGDKDGALEEAKIAVDNVINLWSANTIWKALKNIKDEKTPAISHTAPDFYNTRMQHLTEAGLTPKAADKLLNAISPVLPKTAVNILASQAIESPAIAAGVASGLGLSEFNVGKDIGKYIGAKAKADIGAAKNNYLSLMKQDFQSSPETLDEAFVSALKQAAEPYNKLKLAVAAAREQGTSRSDMVALLKASGVSDEMARSLIRGKSLRASDIAGDLSKDLQGDLIDAMKNSEKKREAQRRYKYNEREIERLLKKYRNVNVEEL